MKILHAVCVISLALNNASTTVFRLRDTYGISLNQERPTYCGNSIAVLDGIAQHTGANELIIVIAHLGDGETRQNLNARRLHNVREYLTEYTSIEGGRRKPEKVILAESERVEGYGRVEFYIKGQHVDTLKIKRNSDLIVGTCYPDPGEDICTLMSDKDFYPCRDRYTTRRSPTRSRRR